MYDKYLDYLCESRLIQILLCSRATYIYRETFRMIITFFMFSLQEGAVGHSFRQFFFMISYLGTRNLKGKPFLIKLKPSYFFVLFSFIFDINTKITVLLKLKHIENIIYHYYEKKNKQFQLENVLHENMDNFQKQMDYFCGNAVIINFEINGFMKA